jgi:hypothetical protein
VARGPLPKTTRSRKDDNARRQAETVRLESTGELAGFALPTGLLPDGQDWHPMTQAFWEGLRAHPVMRDEPAVGWQYALDTARIHHQMWHDSRWDLASEIRLRAAKFAITPEDRQRLKIKITAPTAPTDPSGPGSSVADLAARRSRLTT